MRDRLASTASSTAKTVRTILGDAAALRHEPPTRLELICGICARGSSVPLAVAALVCLVIDWDYALWIGRNWSNTLLVVALIFSFLLNVFLFTNLLLKLVGHPRAIEFRRHLAFVDFIVIALLVIGIEERMTGSDTRGRPLYRDVLPTGTHMLVFFFSIVLCISHFVGGAIMTIAAMRNWVRVQKLSPDEFNDYNIGVRPLQPPPAYQPRSA